MRRSPAPLLIIIQLDLEKVYDKVNWVIIENKRTREIGIASVCVCRIKCEERRVSALVAFLGRGDLALMRIKGL